MDETTYKFLMGASAFVIAILGLMLAATTILPEVGLEKLRKARNILVPSYFVLALLSLVCCLTGYDRRIEPASTLLVASFQALLFTMSMLVFIRPNEVRWKNVFRQAGVITVAGLVLFVSFFRFTDYYSCFFYAGVVAYVLQLIIYTRKFMLAYRKTVQEVEDYYDDDEENRLVWVKCGFFSALAVGIMALSILFFPVLYKYFVPLALSYCRAVKEIELPEATTLLGFNFSQCTALTTLKLPKATKMNGYIVSNCSNLTRIEMTAAGNITDTNGGGLFGVFGNDVLDPKFAPKTCTLVLNADKQYPNGTGSPLSSDNIWANTEFMQIEFQSN